MTSATARALVGRYIELYNTGAVQIAPQIIAPDCVDHTHPDLTPGPASFAHLVLHVRAAFPDLQVVVEQVVADGDTVALRGVVHGTHTGARFAGLPATGKRICLPVMEFLRIAEGQIVEVWGCQDDAALLRQLELLP